MAKKVTEDQAPEAKKAIYVAPIVEYSKHNDPTRIKVDNCVFSWQNIIEKSKKGWGIHRPVERSTELGVEVAEQFGLVGDQFEGLNESTELFYFGGDLVLAYTTVALQKAAVAKDEAAANAQMSILGDDIQVSKTRHTVIDKGPGN